MTTSSGIFQSYLDTLSGDTLLKLDDNDLFRHNKLQQGGDFSSSLNDHLKIIDDCSDTMISYLDDARKKQLIWDLRISKILLFAQNKYELLHQKKENQRKYADYSERCDELLFILKQYQPLSFYLAIIHNFDEALFPYLTETDKKQLQRNLQAADLLLLAETQYAGEKARCQQLLDALQRDALKPSPAPTSIGNPVKYLWLSLGSALAEYLAGSQTKVIIGGMKALNEKRLYWVWGGGLLNTVIDLLPADFFNVGNAAKVAQTPIFYMGCLSWGLYYCRFALNLGLLLKHTIKGPWMSKEESQTPMSERFLIQWRQRKFTLLNDSLWATANLACFFWLIAAKGLGPWGDLLTLALLVFDAGAVTWDYVEQKNDYRAEIKQIDKDIERLRLEIARVRQDEQLAAQHKLARIEEYNLRIFALERLKTQRENSWECQKLSAQTEVAYAVALLLAFALMTLPFLPISGAALMAISLPATVLCFALTVLYNAVKNDIEIYAAHLAADEARAALNQKIGALQNPKLTEDAKKLLFLEIKQLEAELAYQNKMVDFQRLNFFRALLIEALIPPFIFTSFVFLPFGTGLALLALALALAVWSNSVINAPQFKPEKASPAKFVEEEYAQFGKDGGPQIKPSRYAGSFFFKSKPVEQVDAVDERLGYSGCAL